MDISGWPMERIMQLPIEAFGRRWLVGVGAELASADSVFDISEAALPERFIIWEVIAGISGTLNTSADVILALGSKLPTSDAEFDSLELIFSGVVGRTDVRGGFSVFSLTHYLITDLCTFVVSGGRRLVVRIKRDLGTSGGGTLSILISSIPREIPDWMVGSKSDQLDEIVRLLRIGAQLPE